MTDFPPGPPAGPPAGPAGASGAGPGPAGHPPSHTVAAAVDPARDPIHAAAGDPAGDPADGAPGAGRPARRRWWQRLPFLLLVTALPVAFGLYFVAVVGIGILLSDTTREDEARGGGIALLLWWMYSFRQGDTSPYVSVTLLGIAAVFFARTALGRRRAERRTAAVLPALAVLGAVAAAVVAVVPYGYRTPRVPRDEAVRRTLAERAARPWRGIRADQYLVERGRVRFVHAPVYYVALYEKNQRVAVTADGQPCFSRREVWQVDALDGSVRRVTYDDARVVDDPCLPIRLGTAEDLHPVPA